MSVVVVPAVVLAVVIVAAAADVAVIDVVSTFALKQPLFLWPPRCAAS